MKLSKRLQSPIALAVQGFLLGAVLFFTLHPLAATESAPPPVSGESLLAGIAA